MTNDHFESLRAAVENVDWARNTGTGIPELSQIDALTDAVHTLLAEVRGTGSTDASPLNLDAVDAELDEIRANVGHAEAPYNPWALQALRLAENLRAAASKAAAPRSQVAHRG